jgi:hypothetical protein
MKSILLTTLLFLPFLQGNSFTTDPVLNEYQKDVIAYFKEIALGFEYGSASGITRKWRTPMKIFIGGEATAPVLEELDLVISELNELVSDGFRIEIVNNREESNFYIFFGSRNDFVSMYPADTETVKGSSGIFRIFWTRYNYISKGYAFIHTGTSEKEQRHAVREELTQSLGLGKDSLLYPESIFQSKWTLPTEFSAIDREIIRCLYHPRMKVGMMGEDVDMILTDIFLHQNSAF